MLEDHSPNVRIAAADALASYGRQKELEVALPVLVDLADPTHHGPLVAMAALDVLDHLDEKAAPVADQIRTLELSDESAHPRYRSYPERIRKAMFRKNSMRKEQP